MSMRHGAAVALFGVIAPLPLAVGIVRAAPGQTICAIKIEGNQRIETDAIRTHVSEQVGDPLRPMFVDFDMKSIYEMDFFDQVSVNKGTCRDGDPSLTFVVKERPLVTRVELVGMKAFKPDDTEVLAAMHVHPGSISSPFRISQTAHNLTRLYHERGYLDARVIPQAITRPGNTVIEKFVVREGSSPTDDPRQQEPAK